jgi:hypothetical protein
MHNDPHVRVHQDRSGAWSWTCYAGCLDGLAGMIDQDTATDAGTSHANTHGVGIQVIPHQAPVTLPTIGDCHRDAYAARYLIDAIGGRLDHLAALLGGDPRTIVGWLRTGTVPAQAMRVLYQQAEAAAGWSAPEMPALELVA